MLTVVKPITKRGRRIYRVEGRLLCTMFTFFNRLEVHGLENKIEESPCLIVANHAGAAKDVAVLYRIFNRMIFFCAAYYLFDRKLFSQEIRTNYMRMLMPAKPARKIMNVLLTPIREPFAWYISSRIINIGTLPTQAEFLRREVRTAESGYLKGLIQNYLLANRAVALLQADSQRSEYHPYVQKFKMGAASIASTLFKEYDGLEVLLTPISIYGAEGLLTVGKKLIVRVGEPMSIKQFIDRPNPLAELTCALEKRVADMVRQDVAKYGMPKTRYARHTRKKLKGKITPNL